MAVQDVLKAISDRIGGITTVNTVFGEPKVMNHRAIIPVALVMGGFGACGGEEKRPSSEQAQEEGSSGGGGGGFAIRPLAVLEVSEEQTRLIPVLDLTKILLAAMGLIGGSIWIISKTIAKTSGRR